MPHRPSLRGHSRAIPRLGAGRGMTLIELLTALAIALVVITLAYNLFGITDNASRAGIARSTIVQEIYIAETRLRMDFASLVGPSDAADSAAGAIIVMPALRKGMMPQPGRPEGVPVSGLRSDQLVVFYDARHGGLIRDTGNGQYLKSLTRTGVRSAQAKIWYGHVQCQNGESPFAPDWTVGRQATLLIDPDSSASNVPAALETAATLPSADPRATFSPLNTASQASDVAPFSLEETANWMRAAGRTDAQMIAAFAVTPNDKNDYANQPTVVTQPLSDGIFDAADIFSSHRIFLSHRSEFVVQYSVDADCNGLIDTLGGSPYTGTIRWMPRDSDVYDAASPGHAAAMQPVVFYPQDDQARVIHHGYYQGPGIIQGTAAYPPLASNPANPDTAKPPVYLKNKFGDWTPYPSLVNPPGLSAGTYQFGEGLMANPALATPTAADVTKYDNAKSAYAARHNGWQPGTVLPPVQSRWPQLVRVRYRIHDPRGEVYSFNEEFASNKRDDDGDGVVDNPGESRCSGLWAEHIFSIPYPRTN